jgi:hypothetical protein
MPRRVETTGAIVERGKISATAMIRCERSEHLILTRRCSQSPLIYRSDREAADIAGEFTWPAQCLGRTRPLYRVAH